MNGRLDRRMFLGAAAAAAILPASHPAAAGTDLREDPTRGRSLAFRDDFTRLDEGTWHAGPKATTFDSGFYGRSAFAPLNGAEGFNPYAIVDDPLADDGRALQISAKHIGRPMRVYGYHGNQLPEFQWISGNLQTARRNGIVMKGWRRGYFEARMHVPRHPLAWSAFWMMNGRSILYPKTSIEIDVIEHKGFEPMLYGTYLHEWGQPGEHHEGVGVQAPVDLTEGYHRYGMLVTEEACIPYLDRKPVPQPGGAPLRWAIGRSAELDRDGDVFWPLLTLALRTDVPYPDPLRDEDKLVHLRVDEVSVYV